MSNINPIFNDRVRYTLRNNEYGSLIITEPIGWDSDEKEYARHETYHGVIAKFSNSLKFLGTGAEYIQLIYDVSGVNENIELIREEKHPQTDVWTLTYNGFLDLSTWGTQDNKVTVQFNSGGLEQLLKSRESEKVEIDRETTIDGIAIPPLQTIDVELEGRRIFLKSKLEAKEPDNYIALSIFSNGNTRNQTGGVPLRIVNKSHEQLSGVPNQSTANEDNGTTNMMFFVVTDVDRILDIKLNLEFRTNVTREDDVNHGYYQFNLTTYKDGSLYNVKNRITLFTSNANTAKYLLGGSGYANPFTGANNHPPINHSVNWNGQIELLQGESLAVEVLIHADMGSNSSRGHWEIMTDNIVGKITIDEDSSQAPTNTTSIFSHEAGERLVAIGTNKTNAFYSDFLGKTDTRDMDGNLLNYSEDGMAAYTSITHGFWIRNFNKLPVGTEDEPNMFKPLTTSFKDYITSLSAVWNIGVGIEKFGLSERVRVEELSYFYNRNVTIRLPNQIKNVKRKAAADKYYSALEFGYAEGGSYDEAFGLDEYNAKSNFTTIINRVKNIYSRISEYRADSYGKEFARRKQREISDTQDTRYDNSIWIEDLIYRGKKIMKDGILRNLYSERKWQDDFEVEPTGVFSPDTTTNLRFTPFNCMWRSSWWFSGGFKRYLSDYVRYGSSTANSQLKTKLKVSSGGNGIEYAENGNIVNAELKPPRFLPEEIEFDHICDFDVMQQVHGTSTILGKEIPNFYGLLEFTNEKNETEKGFLLNLKPNDKGKWKAITYNRKKNGK